MKLVELAAIMGLSVISKRPNAHKTYPTKVRPKANPAGTKILRAAEKLRLGCWSAR